MECYALVFWDRELADPRGVAGNDASDYHPGNGLCLRCHLNHLHELLERYNAQFAAYLATNAGATWSDDESETLDAPARRPESVVPVTVREVSTDGPEPPEEPDDDALAAYAARAEQSERHSFYCKCYGDWDDCRMNPNHWSYQPDPQAHRLDGTPGAYLV